MSGGAPAGRIGRGPDRISDEVRPGPIAFPHILWATDFAHGAAAALGHAVAVAARYASSLRGLHVAPHSQQVGDSPADDPYRELSRAIEPARAGGIPTQLSLAAGDPAGAILDLAHAWPASLVVLGSQGGRGRRDWALGSVTAGVVAASACPTLTVPLDPTDPGPTAGFRRIVCAVDFDQASRGTIEHALSLARAFASQLDLVHVLEWFPGERMPAVIPELHLDLSAEARTRLRGLVPPDLSAGVLVSTGAPHAETLRLAGEREADLLVVGVHSRRSLDRRLPGSNLCHLLRGATCPVLSVPYR